MNAQNSFIYNSPNLKAAKILELMTEVKWPYKTQTHTYIIENSHGCTQISDNYFIFKIF